MKEIIDTMILAFEAIHTNWKYALVFYGLVLAIPLIVILEEIVIPKIFERIKNGINTRN